MGQLARPGTVTRPQQRHTRSISAMDGGAGQAKQQPGCAGGGKVRVKVNAKNRAKLCKSALLPFEKALLYARSLKLQNVKAWRAWRMTGARPANIPSAPHAVYKHDGWQGHGHWLGTGAVAHKDQQFLPFKEGIVARTLPPAEIRERVEGVEPEQRTPCQHLLNPGKGLQARWAARAFPLAGCIRNMLQHRIPFHSQMRAAASH